MFVYYILFYCFRVISKGLAIRKIIIRKNLLSLIQMIASEQPRPTEKHSAQFRHLFWLEQSDLHPRTRANSEC